MHDKLSETAPAPRRMEELSGIDAATFRADVVPRYRPVVLRRLAGDWPAVAAARRSAAEAAAYLARFDRGAAVDVFVAPPESGGRYFYRPDMAGFNFERHKGPFGPVVREILAAGEGGPSIYIGSAPAAEILPGFAAENKMTLLEEALAEPRIWIGNRSIVSTHFDESDNIACVVAGRRRFTVFPPDQVRNLYVGPLDFTMAGQPASLAPVRDPDFDTYPRFREALAAAQEAVLEPGDAIYIPTLWWHNVEALEPFNILVNYWWRDVPTDAGAAFESLAHGILDIAGLPDYQREAWRAMFDHYVFRRDGDPAAHLPPGRRGILGEQTPQLRQRMRQFLLRALGRY